MTLRDAEAVRNDFFDVVVIGSGFGSAFFVKKLLQRTRGRILVLEWGDHHSHEWQLEADRNTAIPVETTYRSNSSKPWNYTIALGGGTNCWYAQAPRLHPSDFRLKSTYGVGNDWPISYEDLEPYYSEAESIMAIAGDPDMAQVLPRSMPFPQPPHRPSTPDRVMKAAQPEHHFIVPTARARVATETRPACCASLRCWLCPVDAKFTANNGLMDVFEDERVSVCTGCQVRRLEHAGKSITGAVFVSGGREHRVRGDLFVLGANAIQSVAILERSGLGGEYVGKGLHESYAHEFEVLLDGMDNFDGSTITTGINYSLYDGEHRGTAGGALLFFENRWKHGLRAAKGRLREILPIMIEVEDLPRNDNFVTLDESDEAFVSYAGRSDYAEAGMERAAQNLESVLSPLPVEGIVHRGVVPTVSHLQGTLRMGKNAASSVVDAGHLHHTIRNLLVVGSSTFPSCSSANPSLTVAALSLRAADLLTRGAEE